MKEPILVCGLARCGTTLMMSMLDAAGVTTFGRKPWEELIPPVNMRENWRWFVGNAVKVLDPHRAKLWPQEVTAKVIWMHRDPREQARSQLKWLRIVNGMEIPKDAEARFTSSLVSEDRQCMDLFRCLGFPVFRVSFENCLSFPKAVAASVSFFLGRMMPVDTMASVVVKRPAQCAAGLDMERRIMEVQ